MSPIFDRKLERDAITGDAEAQYKLGECYFTGTGAPQNYAKAAKWYRKAAEQGHVKAQVEMGNYCYNRHIYANGVMDSLRAFLPYNDRDKIEAVKWYRKAAEQNYAPAQCSLGSCYDHGDGVAWDKAEAVKWYRKAAELNYAPAHYTLGCCYRDGNGVTKNLVEAYKWFLATRGREEDLRRIEEIPEVGRFLKAGDYVEAQYSLGKYYGEGRYHEKDMVEAVKYYHIAAEQEHAGAQYCLGCCYRDGQGVTGNLVEAYKWFNLASTQRDAMTACENLATLMTASQIAEAQRLSREFEPGSAAAKIYPKAEKEDVEAQYNLGCYYRDGDGVAQNFLKAMKWFRKAAEQNHANAQYNLGYCYKYTDVEGVPKDEVEAVKWFRKAAEQNVARAQYSLGCCYEQGTGVPEDFVEACKWFNLALAQGHKDAVYNLEFLAYKLGCRYRDGDGAQKDAVEAYKWFNVASIRGSEDAITNRDALAPSMTPEQIAEAQRLSREFKPHKESASTNSSSP